MLIYEVVAEVVRGSPTVPCAGLVPFLLQDSLKDATEIWLAHAYALPTPPPALRPFPYLLLILNKFMGKTTVEDL